MCSLWTGRVRWVFLGSDRSSLCVWVLEDSFRADRVYMVVRVFHTTVPTWSRLFTLKRSLRPPVWVFFVDVFHVWFDIFWTDTFTRRCRCTVKSKICIDKQSAARFFSWNNLCTAHRVVRAQRLYVLVVLNWVEPSWAGGVARRRLLTNLVSKHFEAVLHFRKCIVSNLIVDCPQNLDNADHHIAQPAPARARRFLVV